jgi:hypothetical protein
MSGRIDDGFLVLGDVSAIFCRRKEDSYEIVFSHLYDSLCQYGVTTIANGGSPNDVYWLLDDGKELLRYVFTIPDNSTAELPPDTTALQYFLEELDRAFLDFELRRFKQNALSVLASSDKKIELLSPRERGKDTKIAAMWADPSVSSPQIAGNSPPKHILDDRFPVRWVEWKDQLNVKLLKHADEKALVIVVPTAAGILLLNPCGDGHAEFLGSLIP